MAGTKSAIRYAKALLDLAVESNKLDVVEQNMTLLIQTSEETRDLSVFLNSPLIKADKKIAIIHEIFKSFDKITIDFLSLVINNGRDRIILTIAQDFLDLVKIHKGIISVEITSAVELNAKTREILTKQIEKQHKGKIDLIEKINPDLIGGFLIRMGDYQIDASLSGSINKIKQELIK